MENLLKLINYVTEENLPKIKTLLIGIIVFILASGSAEIFLSQFVDLKLRITCYAIIQFIWIIYWFVNKFRLPRNKKKVGIVISIYSENENERQKLKADFISKLKKDLRSEKILDFSEVIFLKNHFSYRIKEANNPQKEVEAINKKIKANFYVWGDVKKRPDGDAGEKYYIYFQGYVVHKPIPQNLSKIIAADFSKILPREINFLEKRSFKGFEASATIIHLAAKYIIGIAAFVSQDPNLAFRLHNGLREQFNIIRPLPLPLQDIRNQIPLLISGEALQIAKWHYKNEQIIEAKNFLDRSIMENNHNYGTWLFKAIVDFRCDNNIDKALESIGKAEQYSNNNLEWRYSKAFLLFWNEDYPNALKLCQKIKRQNYPTENTTLNEVRQFTLEILSKNPTQVQLFFWIGFLSLFKQNNLADALLDFENFEKSANDSMRVLKQKSTAYLRDIKLQMQITN